MADGVPGELRLGSCGYVAVIVSQPRVRRGSYCFRVEVGFDLPCEAIWVRDPVGCSVAWLP